MTATCAVILVGAPKGGTQLTNLKRFAVFGLLALIVTAGVSTTAFAGAGDKDHKVTVCHRAGPKFVQISVAKQALNAHMAHGDTLADEYGECQ